MTPEEHKLLSIAKDTLENPNVFIKLTDYIGMPIEYAVSKLPTSARDKVGEIVQASLRASYYIAKQTIADGTPSWWQTYLNRAAVTVSGGLGGALGIVGAAVEIPISTTIFFREMSQNALVHGFDLKNPKICMEVLSCFALGGRSTTDDGGETGYMAVRASMAKCVSEAAEYLASKAAGDLADDAVRPVIVALLEKIAARFEVVISDEVMAKCVPLIGLVSAVAINNLFMHHFSGVSDAHFFIMKLENKYGASVIRSAYEDIP